MPVTSVAGLARQARALDRPLPCQRENPQLWFSGLPAELELARAHCRPCPLRAPCLAGAVERGEPHGVWGGEIFDRGAIIARKRPRGRPQSGMSGRPRARSLRRATVPGPEQRLPVQVKEISFPNGQWCVPGPVRGRARSRRSAL